MPVCTRAFVESALEKDAMRRPNAVFIFMPVADKRQKAKLLKHKSGIRQSLQKAF
jgi:hypothetical protein